MTHYFLPPRRIEVKIREQFEKLYPEDAVLVKDLQQDEQLCSLCNGLGLYVMEWPYGLKGDDPRKTSFPYKTDNFTPCGACYTGVQTLCEHCTKPFVKGRTDCNCNGAFQEKVRLADEKEAERRKECKQIAYRDVPSDHPIFDVDSNTYVFDGDDLDHTHTYFLCTPSTDWVRPEAARVIENMLEAASQEVEDGEGHVHLGVNAADKLQGYLNLWMKECVELLQTWWWDKTTIVVVTKEDCGIKDEEEDS